MLNFLRIPIRRRQIMLLAVDVAALFVSLPVAVGIRGMQAPQDLPAFSISGLPEILVDFFRYYTGATCISMLVFVGIFFVFDLYNVDRRISSLRDFLYILVVCGLVVVALPTVYYFFPF